MSKHLNAFGILTGGICLPDVSDITNSSSLHTVNKPSFTENKRDALDVRMFRMIVHLFPTSFLVAAASFCIFFRSFLFLLGVLAAFVVRLFGFFLHTEMRMISEKSLY